VSISDQATVTNHFAIRAPGYDRSSSWCTDPSLGELMQRMAAVGPTDHVLDVACGTGLASRVFAGRVGKLVGVDITPEMAEQAREHLDEMVISPAEALPFDDGTFDAVVCRQGLQFMTLPDAVLEMVRVLRPGGRVVLVHICAYGPDDQDEYFEILRLRNPARRNFFLPCDLESLIRTAGCVEVTLDRYVSAEDVDVWSDHGAIGESSREAIRAVYRRASPAFTALHAVRETDGKFIDHMLLIAAVGRKP
jgi:SAM-dependent methyltransferase